MLNRVTIMGRLGTDPELRYTDGKLPVARFSLAVERDFKDKATNQRTTDWISVVAWRATAEFVARYFRKGRVAIVEGRLQTGTYTDKAGNKRSYTEVVAENIYFGDSKPAGESQSAGYGEPPAPSQGFEQLGDEDGTLPF